MYKEVPNQIAQADRALRIFGGSSRELETAASAAHALSQERGAIGKIFLQISQILKTARKINNSSGGSGGNTKDN